MAEDRDRRSSNGRRQPTGSQRGPSTRRVSADDAQRSSTTRRQAAAQRSSATRRQSDARRVSGERRQPADTRRASSGYAQRARADQQASQGEARRSVAHTRTASEYRQGYQDRQGRQGQQARQARQGNQPRQDRSRRPAPAQAARGLHGAQAAQTRLSLPVLTVAVIAVIVVVILAALGIRSCSSGTAQSVGGDAGERLAANTDVANGFAENDGSVVLTLLGDEDTVVLAGEDYIEPGAQAIDRRSGQLTHDVQVEGAVDTSMPGTYQVTYSVQSADGMRTERIRNVHVVETMDADQDGIPVLMYHWVYRDEDPPEDVNSNYISTSSLEAQLQWLTEEGYYFPSHQEIRAYVEGNHTLPAKSVVLTFDDGESGFLEYGIPLFNEYKIPATSYLIGDSPDTSKVIQEKASDYVSFQSHSYGLHTAGSSGLGRGGIIYDKTREEIIADAELMNDMLGMSPSFAYPFGDVSDVAPDALSEAGVLCAYTVNYGNVNKGDDPMRLNRVRVFGESALSSYIYQVETGE